MGPPSRRSARAPFDPPPGPPTAAPRFTSLDLSLLAALGLLWGSAYIFIREGIVLGATPLLFAAIRYLLSAAVFAALAAARGDPIPDARAALVSAAVGGPLVIGLYGGFLYWGEQTTTGGYAAVLAATVPVLTVAAAYLLLPAERFGRLALMGLAIGFGGVVVFVVPDLSGGPGGGWLGPVVIIGAFVSAAVGTTLLRRFGGGAQGLYQLGLQFGVGGLLLTAAVVVLPVPEALPFTLDVWAALAALVVFASILGYFVYFTLHHRVGPVRANVVAYLVPLVGVGIGSGLFAEPVTSWEVGGFLVVLAGVTLILRESSRQARAPRRAS